MSLRRAAPALIIVLCSVVAATSSKATLPDYWSILYPEKPRTPVLDAIEAEGCSVPEDVRALVGEAHRSGTRSDWRRSREALSAWDPARASIPERACVRLQTARLALLQELLPETVAETTALLAADRSASNDWIEPAARWLRLEARYRSGRGDELREEYRALANSADATLSAAARLRLADLQLDSGESSAALDRFESLLREATGVPEAIRGPWRWRAAEAALASGRNLEAARWLDRARSSRLDESTWSIATLQRAALHVASGEGERGAALRSEVRRLYPHGRAARIAEWIDWTETLKNDPGRASEIAGRLAEAAATAPTPRVASFARSLEVDAQLVAGEPVTALERIGVLLVDPWAAEALVMSPRLDRAVLAAARQPSGCARLVAQVAGWEPLVQLLVSEAAPLAALGTCHLEIGLLDSALKALRVARERFGAESVALPMAHASLRSGRADIAENAARDRIAGATPDTDEWRLVLAEARFAVDDPAGAERALADLVRTGRRGSARSRAIARLAALSRQRGLSNETRRVFADAVTGAGEEEWQQAGEMLATAALTAARLTQDAQDPSEAASLYALAAQRLAPGERRARAFYWAGRLTGKSGHAALRAAMRESGPWSELARTRLAVESLGSARIGSGRQDPS